MWIGIWFGILNTCGGVWSNGIEQNRGTSKEYDEDCVDEGFRLARVKFDRADEVRMGNFTSCKDGEFYYQYLKWIKSGLAWSYFENNFPMFLLSGISNTSIFKCVMFYTE